MTRVNSGGENYERVCAWGRHGDPKLRLLILEGITTRCHGYITGGRNDEGLDVSLRVELGNAK